MEEQESDDSTTEINTNKFDFLNKELVGTKITSNLLLNLLANEEKRKTILEARAQELTQVTTVDIKERILDISQAVKKSQDQAANLRTMLSKFIQEKLPNRYKDLEVYEKLDEIDGLQKTRDYVLVVHFIIFVSEKLNTHLREGNYVEAITMFNQLRSLDENVFKTNSDCVNLSKFSAEIVRIWHNELQMKFAREFEKWLETVGWPSKTSTTIINDDTLNHFKITVRCLSRLTGEEDSRQNPSRPLILAEYKEPSTLVEILMKPIRKRFIYHFSGSRATADDTKPEWYFTQIKHWVRDLVPFLQNYIEPIVTEEQDKSAILEFVLSISELLILKSDILLKSSEPTIDDIVFSKLLEEAIRYEAEIKLLFEELKLKGRDNVPGFVSTIFSQPHIISRWLLIEKRGSLEKLDTLFASSSAWNRVVIPGPTEIGELFIMMLRFIVDRFAHLRQPGQRIQFIELLIEILEDFRFRCLQVWNSKPNIDNIDFLVAETLGYVYGKLEEWEDMPFFVTLDFFWETIRKVEKEDLEIRSPFRRSIGSTNEEEIKASPKGLFKQIKGKYTDSMEVILVAISKK